MRLQLALMALTSACRIYFDPLAADAGAQQPADADSDASDAAPTLLTLTFGERATSMFQNVTSDAMLDSSSATLNFGSSITSSVFAPGGEERAIVRFDITGTPADALVVSAVLQLDIAANGDEVAGTLEAHVVTEDWLEGTTDGQVAPGVTWATRNGIVGWTIAGGTTSISTGSIGLGAVTGPVDVPVSLQTVRDWIDSPSANFGLLLRTSAGHWHPYTKEAPNPASRPQLVLEVELP